MKIIIATKNEGKLREIKRLLKGISMPIISLKDLDKKFKIKENGKTFLENALKKTAAVSKVYKEDYVAGEDSGLEVDFLGGAPGIFSKRYAGRGANDWRNNLKLLKQLQGVRVDTISRGNKNRKACYRCCLVLLKDDKLVKSFEGRLNGIIAETMKGAGGFGYDPIFYLPKYKKTVAQLSLTEKNKISHRAKAFKKLKRYLLRIRDYPFPNP